MLEVVKRVARPVLKTGLYRAGALSMLHRSRNRRALTVVIFHRVLARSDPRFSYCDPEYTMPENLFVDCLDFFQQHYTPVSLEDIVAAQLPDHPLLITFDDGWVDHFEVALPHLVNRRMPALAFIAGDAIESQRPLAFWETLLIHGFRAGTAPGAELAALWDATGAPRQPVTDLASLRRLIGALEEVPDSRLREVLAPWQQRLLPGGHRHFLRRNELAALQRNGVALGGHGACHAPMTRLPDPQGDLALAYRELSDATGRAPMAMSFPHGKYSTAIAKAARDRGYQVLFTGDVVLNALDSAGAAPTLGRIELPAEAVSDEHGAFRPEKLALRLFLAPHQRLTGER